MEANKAMLEMAYAQSNVYPKALANFMFREIIEDAHTKYNISQDDMKAMCKEAVNHAMLFIAIKDNEKLYKAFGVEAYGCNEWDDSEMIENLYEETGNILATYEELSHNFE